jgi:GLTT repeat (6 copies)
MGKVTLGLGFGVGYVLGARAGKDRYQQIVQAAQGFLGRPEVQQTIEKARDAAPAPLQGSIDKLTEAASGGQSSQSSSGGTAGAGTSSPGTSSPGTSSPGIASPGIATPGIASPGIASPGIAGAGIPDTEALAAEAAVIEEVGVVATPPTPVSGTGGLAGTDGPVPDPLIPPAKSGE